MDHGRSTRVVRQVVTLPVHASPAAVAALAGLEQGSFRHPAARALAIAVRLVAALGAALAAAAGGIVYLLLLPICGLATIAEAFAKASWRVARGAVRAPAPRGALSQD